MKIPNKLDTKNLPDGFKRQICEQVNNLIDIVKEQQKEINQLKVKKL